MAEHIPVRGRVYTADIGPGRKPWLVVSNNVRNRQLDSCLAVRITITSKPPLPSIVELGTGEPLVLCDDIAVIYRDELVEDRGALAPSTMDAVADALKVALALWQRRLRAGLGERR